MFVTNAAYGMEAISISFSKTIAKRQQGSDLEIPDTLTVLYSNDPDRE